MDLSSIGLFLVVRVLIENHLNDLPFPIAINFPTIFLSTLLVSILLELVALCFAHPFHITISLMFHFRRNHFAMDDIIFWLQPNAISRFFSFKSKRKTVCHDENYMEYQCDLIHVCKTVTTNAKKKKCDRK